MPNLFVSLKTALWRAASILPLPLLIGCAALRPTKIPITHQSFGPAVSEHRTLLVLLPGIRDTETEFVKHGFIAAARERNLEFDIVAVDAHLGYYRKQTLDTRLIEDIIEPARNAGVERVIFAGTSLGGLGSLVMAKRHPDLVDGLVLLAPYVGDDGVIDEIRAAGGPHTWKPEAISDDDFARDLWAWLAQSELPPTVVACGEGDRLIETSRMLAELLPPGRLVTASGGHDWKTWGRLWERLLDGPELREAGILP